MLSRFMALMVLLVIIMTTTLSSAYAHDTSVFVSADWLKKQLNSGKNLRIIEVSNSVSFDFDGHIPGAIQIDKEYWRQQGDDGVRTHLPVAELQKRVRDLGVNKGQRIVLYYKGTSITEIQGVFYAYWILNVLGHQNVSILDMGWHAWLQAEGEMSEDAVTYKKGDFVAHYQKTMVLNVEQLHDIYKKHPLVDGRPHAYWLGEDKFDANIKLGRIPGSVNQPWEAFLKEDDDGWFYADASIKIALLEKQTLDKNAVLLMTCFGAAGAAINYAYFKAAGFTNMRLDDEGYKRWNLHDYPLVKGIAK